MKAVIFTSSAARDMKRHANTAPRIRQALDAYASGSGAHANNVTQLVGSTVKRMRVGEFRVLFEETATEIIVTKVAPRGDVYD